MNWRNVATLFTRSEANSAGISDRQLEWRVQTGVYQRLAYGVYFKGNRPPTQFEHRLAEVMRSNRTVGGELAAALHAFDGFDTPMDGVYSNVKRVDELDALLQIAATTTDVKWEWALECCLRKRFATVDDVMSVLATQRRGNGRIRRVLKLRPNGAPPTGSVLETMAIQLIRRVPHLPTPSRQVNVRHWYLDLAWPDYGIFLELDGEGHKDQPEYDAVRQTGVTAATGWLVGRYTWSAVVHRPNATMRSIADLFEARYLSRTS